MIKIEISNENLDLGKVSVTFELTSPIFNQIGSFSYPFTIPATPKNKRLLSFPGRINKHTTTSNEFAAKIYLKGMLWKIGNLIVDDVGLQDIKCHFTVGEGYFYNLIKEVMLNQVDLGGDIYSSELYTPTDRWEKTYPEVNWTLFPLRAHKFYDSLDHDGFKEYFSTNLFNTINLWDTIGTQQFNLDQNTIVPFVFLNYLVSQVFSHLGINVRKNDIFNNTYLKNLVLINLTSMCVMEPDGEDIDNRVPATFNLQNHVPKKPLNELFSFFEKQFLAFLFYEEKTNTASLETFKNICNKVNVIILQPENITNFILKPEYFDGYQIFWEKDSSDEEMSEPRTRDISAYTVRVVDLYSELPATIPDNELYYVVERATYYRTKLAEEYYSKGGPFNDFKTGLKNVEVKPNAAINPFSTATPFTSFHVTRKDGSYIYQDENEVEESFRVLFYSPEYGTSKPHPYGCILHDHTDTNSQSLAWWGENGLYENFFKEFLQMKMNQMQADFKLKPDLAFLRNLKFQEKYRFHEANWLLSKVKFTVTNDTIGAAQVTAFKI